jgi:hypothetical protein
VAKSYEPASSEAAREWTASYSFELQEPSRSVDESHVFRSGDRFRIRLETDFAAYVYLFSRSGSEDRYTVVHPVTAGEEAPTPSQGSFWVPPDGEWLELGETPTDELMVMVLATLAVPALSFDQPTVPGPGLEPALAGMERGAAAQLRMEYLGETEPLAELRREAEQLGLGSVALCAGAALEQGG